MSEQAEKVALRSIWRDLAEKRIEHGVDWPSIVRTLFRDLDEAERRIALALEASCWDRPYDTRIDAIRDELHGAPPKATP